MTSHWFVFRSKPREETAAWHYLQSQDVTCFYPSMRVNPVNPRARKIKPYFPGYLFVYCDLDQLGNNTFRWMPHSLGLVRFGGEPAVVPENVIQGIRNTLVAIDEAGGETLFDLQPGDDVFIKDGPFAGYRGIFNKSLSGRDRVCVLLTMLRENRELSIEMNVDQIRKE